MQGLVAQDPWNQFIHWLSKKMPRGVRRHSGGAAAWHDAAPDYIFRMFVAMTKDGRWCNSPDVAASGKSARTRLGIEQEIKRDQPSKSPS